MVAAMLFMVAFFVALGVVTAVADARLAGRRRRAAAVTGTAEGGDGRTLVVEIEEWLKQQQ